MLATLITCVIAIFAGTLTGQPAAEVTFRTVARGADSRVDVRREVVARTGGSWQVLWHKHSGADDRPTVDTPREMVLAVFAGRRPAPGHSVHIVGVTREGTDLVVRYRLQVATVATAAGSATTPYQIIAVVGDRSPVRFIEDR